MKNIDQLIKRYGDEYLRYWDANDIHQMCDLGKEEFDFTPRCEGFDENKEFFVETDDVILVSLTEAEVYDWIKEKIAEIESRTGNQNFERFLSWIEKQTKQK